MNGKSISAPVGCGITQFVSSKAFIEAKGRPIVLIYAYPEICAQWERCLPSKIKTISIHNFNKNGVSEDSLVIVSEMHDAPFNSLVKHGFFNIKNEFWLINRDLPKQVLTIKERRPNDSEILDWIERNHTLHRSVCALYVVEGYQVTIEHDCNEIAGPFEGETLRDAYIEAMKHWDKTHGNIDLLKDKNDKN